MIPNATRPPRSHRATGPGATRPKATSRSWAFGGVLIALGLLVGGPSGLASQTPDSVALHRQAKRAQSRLERFRETHLPWTRDGAGYTCDVDIGRFCFLYDYQDDPWPMFGDDPDLIQRRDELIELLDEAQLQLPGDAWILGQRIYYRTELGLWDEALVQAQTCQAEPWWCAAVEGFVRHVRGEFLPAERAFDRALDLMDGERASKWTSAEKILGRGSRAALEGKSRSGPEWRTVWMLADPLLLVEGNDRRTAHFARWVLAEIRTDARNPQGISWGRDMTEITVRFGWSRGWMRRRSWSGLNGFPTVTGRSIRKGRDWMPPTDVLRDPAAVTGGMWVPEDVTPQNLYTPYYAPDLLPSAGQVAIFHRGDSVMVVAATGIPGAPEEPPRPGADSLPEDAVVTWPDLPLREGAPREGLFLIDDQGEIVASHERPGTGGGGLVVHAPAGHYWLSLEAWIPREGRAARLRQGVTADALEPDLVTLSDLLLLDATTDEFERPEETLPLVRPNLELAAGEAVTVAWELYGLGWRDEVVQFELAVFPTGGGLLSTIGRWFTNGSDDPLRVSWTEVGPARPGPWFRHNRIDLSDLESGEYLIQLRVRLRGREDLSVSRVVRVVGDQERS